MKTYSEDELKEEINGLLKKCREGSYWDYKQEWPDSGDNADLVKDIICFANSIHNYDCFLIYGVNDRGEPVEMQKPRRKQADITDMLGRLPWAADNKPTISVRSIEENAHHLDILIIHNSDRTPFYLKNDYTPKNGNNIEKSGNSGTQRASANTTKKTKPHTLQKGVVYTRSGDRNTGWTEIAPPYDIEQLWRKRFGLLKSSLEQFYDLTKNPDDWSAGSDYTFYHRYHSEFTIAKESCHEGIYTEFFVYLYPDHRAFTHKYTYRYFNNVIREFYIAALDGSKFSVPFVPASDNASIGGIYFYMLEDSPEWHLQQLIYEKNGVKNVIAENNKEIFYKHIPLFCDASEKNKFEKWMQNNTKSVNLAKQKFSTRNQSSIQGTMLSNYRNNLTVMKLLKEFRDNNS